MAEVVKAVYERGLLRPLEPLELQEQQTVRIQVLPDEVTDEEAQVVRILIAAGLLQAVPAQRLSSPPSKEERLALAEQWGRLPGKPLSEIVIEERGER